MKRVLASICLTALATLWTANVAAQSLAASSTTANVSTTNNAATVTLTSNGTASFDFVLNYDTTRLSIQDFDGTPPDDYSSTLAGVACALPQAGQILCFGVAPAGTYANGTITFLFDTNTTTGIAPLTFGTVTCAPAANCTTTDGQINVLAGPEPEVNAVPAPGARTITDQIGGGATNDVITISNTGVQATTLTLSVAETSDPSAAFTGVLSSGSVAGGSSATLTVGCTATAEAPVTATYTVTTNDSDEPSLVYTYTCTGTVGPAPEVNAVPAPGARTINDSVGGGATNDVITISNTGSAALTLSVAETGDASGVFTGTLGTGSVAAGGSTTLTVGCAATGAGPFTATYTVTTNDSDEPTLVYTYTCNGVVAPEFASTPAAGSTISLLGAPGAVLGGSVILQNTGTASLTVGSCTAAGGFTVTSPTFPATIAAGGQTTVNFTCTAPAAAGGSFQGTLTCTGITDADEPTATFSLTCSSQVLAVPTMSPAGKALLATLLAGLGLLGFAMRRKLA